MSDDLNDGVVAYNRRAWDRQVAKGNRWTLPVDAKAIAQARLGDPQMVLTPNVPVPRSWLAPLQGADVLGLASAGGQQMPLFAAAGATVVSFDNSAAQLARDTEVAQREGLQLQVVQGDMADLSALDSNSFDLVFHPVSNCFAPNILPVWREVARVLRPGGHLLAGWVTPCSYIFDDAQREAGKLVVRHRIPYSDLTSIRKEERQRWLDEGEPLVFGHSLSDQIGGQLKAGLALVSMYEDNSGGDDPLDKHMSWFVATRAMKL